MNKSKQDIPFTGWKGLTEHWRNDLIAAISVSLVALPLSLAIAVAAGVPPISGLVTAAVGGFVVTLFRSSQLTINGPAAGMIGVIFAGIAALDDGSGTAQAFQYFLAATIVAGALQVLTGVFRFGRIAEIFPSTVIHGILASIGIIIFAKQAHVAMGTESDAENTIGIIQDIFYKIPEMDPFIFLISGIGLVLMIWHSRISYKVFHFIPAPVWVLAIAVPIVLGYQYLETHEFVIFGEPFKSPENYLIKIPDDWMESFVFPDFSKIHTLTFWLVVISIHLISTVITLAGVKSIDKLDPYRRKSDVNKDLIGVGVGSMVSGAVGGLPVLAVIVRSTVNVHNLAKTKWSNFYHGIFIALFVLLLLPVIQLFPKAALAAVLVVTGIKLASPRVFKEIYETGLEQVIFVLSTIIITLYRDPLSGLIGGMIVMLIAHLLISRVTIADFIQMIFKSGTSIKKNANGSFTLRVKGIANFLTMLRLIRLLEEIPPGANLKIDLSRTRLIDLTFQEKILSFRRAHRLTGGKVQVVGLDEHVASSNHKLALKSHIVPKYAKPTPREQRLKRIAVDHGWIYTREEQVETSELYDFNFFESRPLERKFNVIAGEFPESNVDWEISDVIFDEGAMLSKEVYKTTVQLIHLPKEIPDFVMEKEGIFDKLFDRVLAMTGHKDIDFVDHPDFSKNTKLTGNDEEGIKRLFTDDLISFLETEEIYHIECNGRALLIFKSVKKAETSEIKNMVRFSEELVKYLV